MNTTPKPGQIAILAGGVVLLIFSFVTWGDGNAWSDFGVPTWPAIFGVIAAGTLAAVLFGNVDLPEPVLSFTWPQIRLVLGFTATLIMLGLALVDGDKGAGLWLSFLGAIALLAGAVMEVLDTPEGTSTAGPGSTPPQSF
jgi:hypothetical protein